MSKDSPKVSILRLGHRLVRDDRVSTHIGLAARAFGADEVWFAGVADDVKPAIDDVTERFGGKFEVRVTESWREVINDWKARGGITIHLTMYGTRVDDALDKIISCGKDILIIVGSKKVPRDLFSMSDHNISVSNQPHSEVSALAVFLDRFFGGEELKRKFPNYKIRVIPDNKRKKMEIVD